VLITLTEIEPGRALRPSGLSRSNPWASLNALLSGFLSKHAQSLSQRGYPIQSVKRHSRFPSVSISGDTDSRPHKIGHRTRCSKSLELDRTALTPPHSCRGVGFADPRKMTIVIGIWSASVSPAVTLARKKRHYMV
jgi:hypothetical protein